MHEILENAPRTMIIDGHQVTATRCAIPITERTSSGEIHIAAGDWLIVRKDGPWKSMTAAEFSAKYGLQALLAGIPADIVGRPVNFGSKDDPRNVNY